MPPKSHPLFLIDGPAPPAPRLLLAHGAGAPMDSDFMARFAAGLGAAGVGVVRFEFPYMRRRREEGVRPGPNRMPELLEAFKRALAESSEGSAIFIGGKSMGGRVASMLADQVGAAGLVCLGYPFHPAGKPEQLRTAHLAELRTPTVIVQGTRDALGSRQDVAGYVLSPAIAMCWLEDGDHSFEPRKVSGRNRAQAMAEAISAVAAFIHGQAVRGSAR